MDKITIAIVVVFCIGFLYYYYKKKTLKKMKLMTQTWPVEYQSCPDYWVHRGNGECINVHKLGTKRDSDIGDTINFSKGQYEGVEGNVSKCRWAKQNNVSWEGIDSLSNCN